MSAPLRQKSVKNKASIANLIIVVVEWPMNAILTASSRIIYDWIIERRFLMGLRVPPTAALLRKSQAGFIS